MINAAVSGIAALQALAGNPLSFVVHGLPVFGEIPVRIDALAGWFILIINFTLATGCLYGTGYMKAYHEQRTNLSLHWILFIFFHLSMLAVCVVQNGLVFPAAWEIMSLSSMLLVIFEHHKTETVRAGINYLIQMHLCVLLLSAGVIGYSIQTGSYDFLSISGLDASSVLPLFFCFFAGFAFKAGFIPLHTWLPHAYPAAPSHISGIMSGVMIKTGIYGILRMIQLFPAGQESNYLIAGRVLCCVRNLRRHAGHYSARSEKAACLPQHRKHRHHRHGDRAWLHRRGYEQRLPCRSGVCRRIASHTESLTVQVRTVLCGRQRVPGSPHPEHRIHGRAPEKNAAATLFSGRMAYVMAGFRKYFYGPGLPNTPHKAGLHTQPVAAMAALFVSAICN